MCTSRPSSATSPAWSTSETPGNCTPINPSFIKETIVRKEPDFDEREFGFSTFSRLLEAMEKEGLCQRIQQGRQWYVVSKEGGGSGKANGQVPPEPSEDGVEEVPHEPEEEPIPDPEE